MHFQVLSAVVTLASFAVATSASHSRALSIPNPLPGSATVALRDPSIFYNPDSKKYFVFSTGPGFIIYTSKSLEGPWTQSGEVLPNGSKIDVPGGQYGYWAPDISKIDDKYILGYSLAQNGKQNYYSGIATSPSMEPGTWTDLGEVFRSIAPAPFFAIDTNLFHTANGTKLNFGSFIDGMFHVNLDANLKTHSALPGTKLAGGNNRAAEGGFLYKPPSSDWYFFFFSAGKTILKGQTTKPPAGQEYHVRVGRSESPSGPFVDKLGNALTEDLDPPTGTVILDSHDNVYAPGGQSIFHDPVSDRDVIVYHYVPLDKFGGPSFLGINFLDFSSGWPVVVA